jgi:hypothetical protein
MLALRMDVYVQRVVKSQTRTSVAVRASPPHHPILIPSYPFLSLARLISQISPHFSLTACMPWILPPRITLSRRSLAPTARRSSSAVCRSTGVRTQALGAFPCTGSREGELLRRAFTPPQWG